MGVAPGRVYLIGAGPGAPDLITLRGARAIRAADVLVVDELLPRSMMADLGVPLEGKTIEWLGDGGRHKTQDEINAILSGAALAGKVVARVKTGDPFVFGRGGEEIEHLAGHGIPWEVIPGASSALAAPGAAGLSLTTRGDGRSFAVATARLAGGGVNQQLPRADSLVLLMGAEAMSELAKRLISEGWKPETPVAIVERGTQPWERRAEGTLSSIAEVAARAGISSPAVLVVGSAARRPPERARLRVLYTGLDATDFRMLGDVIHWPALESIADEAGLAALPEILDELAARRYEWVVFTSPAGVRAFLSALKAFKRDVRVLAGARIATAGAGTAWALGEANLNCDAVAGEIGSPGILSDLGKSPGGRVLLVQGRQAPPNLARSLESAGWSVTRLPLHNVVPHPELGKPLPGHDVIYFASPSGVRAYRDAYGESAFAGRIWCIGEATRRELENMGKTVEVVKPHGV